MQTQARLAGGGLGWNWLDMFSLSTPQPRDGWTRRRRQSVVPCDLRAAAREGVREIWAGATAQVRPDCWWCWWCWCGRWLSVLIVIVGDS